MSDNTRVKCVVTVDDFTKRVSESFDYEFDGYSEFVIPTFDTVPNKDDFNIGLIVGSSGSGKTQMLKRYFGTPENPVWDNSLAIVSQIDDDPDIAVQRLFSCGVSSVPTLCRPWSVLSNGEQHRADMARRIKKNAVIDEFTSVVNRETAKSLSTAISKYIKKENITGVVFSSCHKDIIDWLEPDWVFNTDTLTNEYNDIDVSSYKKVGRIIL